MKLTFDPMAILRANAVTAVNKAFNDDMLRNAHRDQAHAAKRSTAAAVKAGRVLGDDDPLAAEAKLRSMTVDQFADVILSKPDSSGQRELERQRHLLAVDAAKTPADIELIQAALAVTTQS